MSYHTTKSGHIELLDSWGHGKHPRGDWRNRPATLISDDDDGHFDAWAYSGDKKDAAMTIAGFFRDCGGEKLAYLDGDSVLLLCRADWPEGVEVEKDNGDFEYHPEAVPGGLMVV